jgi:hypothetical protein
MNIQPHTMTRDIPTQMHAERGDLEVVVDPHAGVGGAHTGDVGVGKSRDGRAFEEVHVAPGREAGLCGG